MRLFNGGDSSEGYDAALNWYSQFRGYASIWPYHNDEVDQLFESARMASDQKTKADIYKKIHKIVYQDQPACFLFYPAGYFAVNAKLKDTEEYFTLRMPTYTIKNWYVEDAK